MPEKPFNIAVPTNEQLWACLQRCLAFEDPGSRWERLQNLIRKQINGDLLKTRDVPGLPLPFQDHLFTVIYGKHANGSEPNHSDKLPTGPSVVLNVVLALEDIQRFTEIAFESWKVSIPADGTTKEIARLFPRDSDDPAIAGLARRLGLSSAQEMWLQHARRAVPDWQVLGTPGPWSSDPRTVFLTAQLKKLSKLETDVDGYLQAKALFEPQLEKSRDELPGNFLPHLILLVEGETESILLPHFANLLGFDFGRMGIMLVSAGGGKQVARKYFELRDVVSLPIVLFTDADAGEEIEVAAEALREHDRLHIWKEGEIEDTLDRDTLVQQLNTFLQTSGAPGYVSTADFPDGHRRTAILNRLWRARGLGNFDKIGFAEVVAANLRERGQVPRDVVAALNMVRQVLEQTTSKQQANKTADG